MHEIVIRMTLGHFVCAPDIFPGFYLYPGALSRVLGFDTLLLRSIPPVTVCLSIDYIGVTLVSLPRYQGGYLQRLLCRSLGRGWIAHLLYTLNMRATIIVYVPPLVVYGSFEPLLGKTYLLHSGDHISCPRFSCILAVDSLRSVFFVH